MLVKNKIEQLKQVGTHRKQNCYPGYEDVSNFLEGKYDSEFVSPYTKSACNSDSSIIILLQDWASSDYLKNNPDKLIEKLGYAPSLPTNKNLKVLLKEVFNLEINQVFVTNVFPYIKSGSVSADLPTNLLNRAFSQFCIPQIQIINPKLVVCCGSKVFGAAINHFVMQKQNKYPVGKGFIIGENAYCHQRHPGFRGINTDGGISVAIRNWETMKTKFYDSTGKKQYIM